MYNIIKYYFTFSIITYITGCAYSNEGAVDLRRVNAKSSVQVLHKEVAPLYKLQIKNFSLGSDQEVVFREGDSLSMHLRSAYIKTFSDDHLSPYFTKAFTRQWGKANGELAIVANALEMKDGNELSFNNQRDGRVVFYSDDVNQGQFLNFNNMPIYGPLEFEGNPVALRLTILELDVSSAQGKAMLKTVSEYGSQAYPPASPVLGILNGLGNTLLAGDQTDTEFRYSMIFDPQQGSQHINHFVLEAGNYILIRSEDRDVPFDWNKVFFDENEAKLYKKAEQNHKTDIKYDEFTDATYLVVEINKNISNKNVELEQNNYGTLIQTLEQQDQENANNWTSINEALTSVSQKREQKSNFIDAKKFIASVKNKKVKISKITALATITPEQKAIRLEMLLNAREDIKKVFSLIVKSIDQTGAYKTTPLKPAPLSENNISYLNRELRVLAGNALTTQVLPLFELSHIFTTSNPVAASKLQDVIVGPI